MIAAVACFGSGVAVGLVLPGLVEASPQGMGNADEYFVNDLVEGLGLTAEQADTLRVILAAKEAEEIQLMKDSSLSGNLPPALQKALDAAREKADRRIRIMLDEEQRARYQELVKMEKDDRWPRP